MLEAFDSNWIAPLGPHVDAFEKEFAALLGANHAVALSCGTAALHLALLLLGVGPGDEVLTSTLTFAATANAITYVGATPVFIDSDRATWNMDPESAGRGTGACARRRQLPKAVVVVDLYGQCADYEPICAACARYGVPLIEDAAEALGATYRRPVGRARSARSACFSFNGNKIITTSGGGMLVCRRRGPGRTGPLPGHPGPRPGAALPALRDRLQLPHEQPAGRRRPRAAAGAGGAGRDSGGRTTRSTARPSATCRASPSCPRHPRGRSTRWLTCITVDPDAFGATTGRHPPGPGGREHRGAADLEADAPATGLRGLPGTRRGRGGRDFSARALPAERIESGRGRPATGRRLGSRGGRLPAHDAPRSPAQAQGGVVAAGAGVLPAFSGPARGLHHNS